MDIICSSNYKWNILESIFTSTFRAVSWDRWQYRIRQKNMWCWRHHVVNVVHYGWSGGHALVMSRHPRGGAMVPHVSTQHTCTSLPVLLSRDTIRNMVPCGIASFQRGPLKRWVKWVLAYTSGQPWSSGPTALHVLEWFPCSNTPDSDDWVVI